MCVGFVFFVGVRVYFVLGSVGVKLAVVLCRGVCGGCVIVGWVFVSI